MNEQIVFVLILFGVFLAGYLIGYVNAKLSIKRAPKGTYDWRTAIRQQYEANRELVRQLREIADEYDSLTGRTKR